MHSSGTKCRLGNTDIEIAPLGLGCWQFSQGKGLTGGMWSVLDQGTTDAVVGKALAEGMNWFDTAEGYGNGQSKRALATALHNLDVPPGKVVIATKWLPLLRTAGNIPRTIDKRLSGLSGYPIDLCQIRFSWGLSSIASETRQMAGLQRAGKIRSIGVSNYPARQMEKVSQTLQAEGMVLAANQVPISFLDRRIERNGMLAAAQRLGVKLIAYSPLAQGLLSGRFHAHPERRSPCPSPGAGHVSALPVAPTNTRALSAPSR